MGQMQCLGPEARNIYPEAVNIVPDDVSNVPRALKVGPSFVDTSPPEAVMTSHGGKS